MDLILYSLLIVQLIGVTIEDFKNRAIWWGWIPLLILTCTCIAIRQIGVVDTINFFIMNIGFISIQLLLVTCWFSLKEKKLTNITNQYLGLGDILFFIPLCLLFSPINFIAFYLTSLILVLVSFIILKSLLFNNIQTIPLAGGISIFLICFFTCNFFLSWNRYLDGTIFFFNY